MLENESCCCQLELIEAKSRGVDEAVSELLNGAPSTKAFRRPPQLQCKRWPPEQQVTVHSHRVESSDSGEHCQGPEEQIVSTTDNLGPELQNASASPATTCSSGSSDNQSVPCCEIVERTEFYLSGRAFSSQDIVTACIDSWYPKAVNSTTELKFKKRDRPRRKRFQASTNALSSADVCNFLSQVGNDECGPNYNVLSLEGICHEHVVNAGNCGKDKNVDILENGQVEETELQLELQDHYSLRSQSACSGAPVSPEKISASNRTLDSNTRVLKKRPFTDSSSPLKKTSNHGRLRKRPRTDSSSPLKETSSHGRLRKRPRTDSSSLLKETSSHGRLRKRPRTDCSSLSKNTVAVRTGRKRLRSYSSEHENDIAVKESSDEKDASAEPCGTEDEPEAKRYRKSDDGREKVQQDINSPHKSNDHADMRNTASRQKQRNIRNNHTAAQTQTQRRTTKRQATGESSTSSTTSPHPGRKGTKGLMLRHRLRHNRRRVVIRNTGLLCCSCKHGFLRSECLLCASLDSVTHRIVQKARRGPQQAVRKCAGTSAMRSSANLGGIKKGPVEASLNGSTASSKENLSAGKLTSRKKKASDSLKRRSPQARRTKAGSNGLKRLVNRSTKNVKAKEEDSLLSKTKRKSQSPLGKCMKGKSCSSVRGRKGKSTEKAGGEDMNCGVLESSVIDFHRRVSSSVDNGEDLTCTKDVFSQLCRLEERSKDYDLSALHTLMPAKEQSLQCRPVVSSSKGVAVYSRTSSHVGGVWSSILS